MVLRKQEIEKFLGLARRDRRPWLDVTSRRSLIKRRRGERKTERLCENGRRRRGAAGGLIESAYCSAIANAPPPSQNLPFIFVFIVSMAAVMAVVLGCTVVKNYPKTMSSTRKSIAAKLTNYTAGRTPSSQPGETKKTQAARANAGEGTGAVHPHSAKRFA